MPDYMARAVGGGGNIRAFVASTTGLVEEAHRRHDTWPTATAALGRALTGTALFSATLKDEGESITIRIAGDGPLGGIVCDADNQGQVRGYANNPHTDLDPNPAGKFDVAGAVGQGLIHVTRMLSVEGMYTGTSEIVSGEIAEDLTYYLTQSEQTASAVALGVRVAPDGSVVSAGGYMVQLLPATATGEREQLEINLASLGAISSAVEEGLTPEQILAQLMAGIDFKILETRDLHFACRCSRERALGSLALLSTDELAEVIAEEEGAEMSCQFCGDVFRFGRLELEGITQGREAGAH